MKNRLDLTEARWWQETVRATLATAGAFLVVVFAALSGREMLDASAGGYPAGTLACLAGIPFAIWAIHSLFHARQRERDRLFDVSDDA